MVLVKKILGCSASPGQASGPPAARLSHFCCSRNVIIIPGIGADFAILVGEPSRSEKLTMKIKIQTAAKLVQIRRQGKINSCQIAFKTVVAAFCDRAFAGVIRWESTTVTDRRYSGLADGVELRRGGLMAGE